MNVVGAIGQTTTNYGSGYSSGAQAATATGTIHLSMQKLGTVMATYGYSSMTGSYSGYNTYGTTAMPTLQTTMTQLCATGIAISMSHNGYNLYGGRVYLYLNVPSVGLTGQTSALGAGHGTYLQF
jgi:hypothetical protein